MKRAKTRCCLKWNGIKNKSDGIILIESKVRKCEYTVSILQVCKRNVGEILKSRNEINASVACPRGKRTYLPRLRLEGSCWNTDRMILSGFVTTKFPNCHLQPLLKGRSFNFIGLLFLSLFMYFAQCCLS